MDIVYLDFRKAFNSLKLLMHMLKELDKQTVSLTENWLNQQDLRVVITGTKSSWRSVASGIP